VLLQLIVVCGSNTADFLSESIDLTRDSFPEDLIKHGICHVVVRSTLLVFGHGKGMLFDQQMLDSPSQECSQDKLASWSMASRH